jgi:hypothetical protein
MDSSRTDSKADFSRRGPFWLSFAGACMVSVGGAGIAAADRSPDSRTAPVAVAVPHTAAAEQAVSGRRVRFENPRIAEVFRYALKKSAAFEDLVATLELADRVVYISEGNCRHHMVRGCVSLMPTPGGRNILVRIAPRELIQRVAAQLAHELYHAAEIGRAPNAVDDASMRALYRRIGERSCDAPSDDCWETRAAVAFERLVTQELNGVTRLRRGQHHPTRD